MPYDAQELLNVNNSPEFFIKHLVGSLGNSIRTYYNGRSIELPLETQVVGNSLMVTIYYRSLVDPYMPNLILAISNALNKILRAASDSSNAQTRSSKGNILFEGETAESLTYKISFEKQEDDGKEVGDIKYEEF